MKSTSQNTNTNTHAHILLVDDEPDMLAVLSSILERLDYQVSFAHNLEEGKEILQSRTVDAVLCDALLRSESGYDLLRFSNQQKAIPFVIMTGCLDPIMAERASQMGASGFLLKPFRVQDLANVLKKAVQKVSRVDSLGTQENRHFSVRS